MIIFDYKKKLSQGHRMRWGTKRIIRVIDRNNRWKYRRFYIPASTWSFAVNLAERRDSHLLVDRIDLLLKFALSNSGNPSE